MNNFRCIGAWCYWIMFERHSWSWTLFVTLLTWYIAKISYRKNRCSCCVKQAFLQTEMNEHDRNLVRFLWFDGIHKENPSIVEYYFIRLAFGLTCSPFLLNTTVRHHLTKYSLFRYRVKNHAFLTWMFLYAIMEDN